MSENETPINTPPNVDDWFPERYREMSSLKAQDTLFRAFSGDPKAIATIFDGICYHEERKEPIPEDFLLYLHFKSSQLKKYNKSKILTCTRLKKPGRRIEQPEIVKMLHYLIKREGLSIDQAAATVGNDLGKEPTTIKDYYYQWSPTLREKISDAPHKYAEQLGWHRAIMCRAQYDLAKECLNTGADVPYTINDVMRIAYE